MAETTKPHRAKSKEDSSKPSLELGEGLAVQVVEPRAEARTILLCFHGGGGIGGSPDMLAPFCELLAQHSATRSMLVRYRTRKRDRTGLEEALADARRALDWALSTPSTGTDFYLLGASFGGLLALDAALGKPERLSGLILFNPVTDTSAEGFTNRVLGPQGRKDLSPIDRYRALPATEKMRCFIAHGGADKVVPVEHSRRFCALWPQGRCELVEEEKAKHGFFIRPRHRTKMVERVRAFIESPTAAHTLEERHILPKPARVSPLSKVRTVASMTATPLTLHAGFHKTGSTLIQGTLAQTPSLDTVGLGFVPAKVLHGSPFFARFREHRRSRRPSDDVVPQLQSEFAELTKHLGGSRWLLTHEDLLGNPPAGFYKVAARAIRLLRRVVGPRELRFILYIKRQDRMLESIYKQRIQMGRTLDFETFLGELDVTTFSWARVLNDVALEVGEENVVVKLAEDANLGAESFVRDFVSTVIGEPFSAPISIPENTNQSLSGVALECAKRCNELLTPKQQREFRLFLRAQLTGPGFAPAKLLGDDDRARILAMHAKGNREVFERFLKERDPAAYLNP